MPPPPLPVSHVASSDLKIPYHSPAVRQRLTEFLGGGDLQHATAAYLTHSDGVQYDARELRPPAELESCLDRELDVARSLADSESCLLHLDVEYVNFDSPSEAYTDPWRAFELQEPLVRAIEAVLLEHGIRPFHLITGQGHHFVWRIRRTSAVGRRLLALAPAPELAAECMLRLPALLAGRIDSAEQNAFFATGLLMEYLAHRVKERAAGQSPLPVEITAVHVGPVSTGRREILSIDISEYGDPLHTRMIRMPFSHYLKPWSAAAFRALHLEDVVPRFYSIPMHEMDFRQAIKVRQVPEEVCELAERACARIPLEEEGTTHLLEHYLSSRLRMFHEHFYSARHDPRECWQHTYQQTPLDALPHCARHLLECPNDMLLKPAGMQLITRVFTAQGWHPRHIAGLIRSKFENASFGWGLNWGDYEPGTRADFYTRLFSGLLYTGLDHLVDFNCTSTQEKGFCFITGCGCCGMEPSYRSLVARLPTM